MKETTRREVVPFVPFLSPRQFTNRCTKAQHANWTQHQQQQEQHQSSSTTTTSSSPSPSTSPPPPKAKSTVKATNSNSTTSPLAQLTTPVTNFHLCDRKVTLTPKSNLQLKFTHSPRMSQSSILSDPLSKSPLTIRPVLCRRQINCHPEREGGKRLKQLNNQSKHHEQHNKSECHGVQLLLNSASLVSRRHILTYTLLFIFLTFSQVSSSQSRHSQHQQQQQPLPPPPHSLHHPHHHHHHHHHAPPSVHNNNHFLHRQHPQPYSPVPPSPRDPYVQHHFSLLPASNYQRTPQSSLQQYHHQYHPAFVPSGPVRPSYASSYGPSYSPQDASPSVNPPIHSNPSVGPLLPQSPPTLAGSSVPSVVKHPGTCTFQRSQPACTFSLLCYLAGGLPVEGCEGDIGLTCCMLSQSKSAQSGLPGPTSVSSINSPPPPSPGVDVGSLGPVSSVYTSQINNHLPHQQAGHGEHQQSSLSPNSSPVTSGTGGVGGGGPGYLSSVTGGSSYQPSNHLSNGPSSYPSSSYQEFPAYPPINSHSSPINFDSYAYGLEYSKQQKQPSSEHHLSPSLPPPPPPPPPPAASSSLLPESNALVQSNNHKPLSVSSHSLSVPVQSPVIQSHALPVPAAQVHPPSSDLLEPLSKQPQGPVVPPSTSSLSLSSLSVQSPSSSTPNSLLASSPYGSPVQLSTSTGSPVGIIGDTFDEPAPVTDNSVRRTIPGGNSIDINDLTDPEFSSAFRPTHEDEICGRPTAKPRSRIIGGQDAYFGEFPWQVHIKIAKHQCGGALVNRDYVVTAAHCVYQAPLHQLSIIIGAHDIEDPRFQQEPPQYFSVAEVKLHPEFRFSASHPDRYDVAVLRLDKPARYSSNILPVCLPPKSVSFEGWFGVVTGWGKTDPALSNRYGTRLLQKVDVPIIKNHDCETWHHTRGIDLKIFPEMFCAGYEDGRKDACVGDSGGPLVVFLNNRWTLAGITSAGFGCAQSRQPGIYHRLPVTVDWVRQNIAS